MKTAKQMLLLTSLLASAACSAFELNPDRSVSADGPVTMAPDGTFHSGTDTQMTPAGGFVGQYGRDRGTSMNPDGRFTGGNTGYLRPDGSYGSTPFSEMTPGGFVDRR